MMAADFWRRRGPLLVLAVIIVMLLGLNGCQTRAASVVEGLPTRMPTAVVPTVAPSLPAATAVPPHTPTTIATTTPLPPTETPVIPPFSSSPTPVPTNEATPTALLLPTATTTVGEPRTIGFSSQGRPIEVYTLNDGPEHVILVGGIHGGYEWNTIILAYEMIDYFLANPEAVPANVTLHIIPSANPDGQALVTGTAGRFSADDVAAETAPGRFNGNGVDLNRNWDCEWMQSALWRETEVDAGERPFSEPETIVLRDYIMQHAPEAVVFWHSAANGVFAAGCPETHAPSLALARIFGEAAGYPVYERFTAYPITGDAGDWLTTQDIPTFTVELRNHQSPDWPQNLAGVQALLQSVTQP